MDATLTVSQLAEAVAPVVSYPDAPTEEHVDLVIRRLRGWTVAGALPPLGDPNSGTGKHRRYGPEALIVAAVLNALAQNDQSIKTLLAVSAFIRGLTSNPQLFADETILAAWKTALAGKEPVYLVTSAVGERKHWQLVTGDGNLERPLRGLLGGIFVNVTAVLSRIRPV